MRPVPPTTPPPPSTDPATVWCIQQIQALQRASQMDNPGEAADNFAVNGLTENITTLDLTAPTLAQVGGVLGTFLSFLKKRGKYGGAGVQGTSDG